MSFHGQNFQHVGLPGLTVTAIHGQENEIPAGEKAPVDQKLNGPRFKIFGQKSGEIEEQRDDTPAQGESLQGVSSATQCEDRQARAEARHHGRCRATFC